MPHRPHSCSTADNNSDQHRIKNVTEQLQPRIQKSYRAKTKLERAIGLITTLALGCILKRENVDVWVLSGFWLDLGLCLLVLGTGYMAR